MQLLENVIVGPLVAVLSFVCSVGNVPLAAVLWAGGISFSGVIAFIYADLIIVPLVLVYGRYYGWRVAAMLVTIMFGAIVAAALAVDGIFSAFGLIPSGSSVDRVDHRARDHLELHDLPEHRLHLRGRRPGRPDDATWSARPGVRHDRRPRRGLTAEHRGRRYFFCGPGCRAKFEADPSATRLGSFGSSGRAGRAGVETLGRAGTVTVTIGGGRVT